MQMDRQVLPHAAQKTLWDAYSQLRKGKAHLLDLSEVSHGLHLQFGPCGKCNRQGDRYAGCSNEKLKDLQVRDWQIFPGDAGRNGSLSAEEFILLIWICFADFTQSLPSAEWISIAKLIRASIKPWFTSWHLAGNGEARHRLVLEDLKDVSQARFMESYEAKHSNQSFTSRLAQKLGVSKAPLRLDSQTKYGNFLTDSMPSTCRM